MIPRALVVFTDQTDVAWLQWLGPGFRHCFVVVRDPAGEWIACDWLKGRFAFRAYGPCDPRDLALRFTARGHHVVLVADLPPRAAHAVVRPLTCVEVVKQALGLTSVFPLTPQGLFHALRDAGHEAHGPKV